MAVRPQDASLVYNLANLALLCGDGGDVPAVRRHRARALTLAPNDRRTTALAASLRGSLAA